MTTTRPLSRPVFHRPDPWTTGPGRIPAAYLAPIFGSDPGGYRNAGDALVSRTADGVPINQLWDESAAVVSVLNEKRTKLSSLVSYSTTSIADPIVQSPKGVDFEKASEYGVPVASKTKLEPLLMGYDFNDYDTAARFTWRFLRDATAEHVRAHIGEIIEADNRKVTGTVLRRLFDNTQGSNEFQHPVRPLYTGKDGLAPPPYMGQVFPQQTSHMLSTGAPVLDSRDLEHAIKSVSEKGYGVTQGSQLLILCHPNELDQISTFRRGVPSRPRLSGESEDIFPKFDFIQSATAPAYLTDENVIGKIAPGEYGGLPVAGSYGPAWVISDVLIPMGYVAIVATGGPNSSMNPVAFRQHANPDYQGLRIIPGGDSRYPLVDSYFARGFGTGVRHRGAAFVLQVHTDLTYTPPTWAWS
ncbi:hypothetical protein [Rhodococcus sp. SORGH_AS_0303]|uniref:hypothetical protein n=1 Tax=Rhodococcus sp. SORGH_AS_0303 TaxID=3041753 RepID=UPI0027826EEA|nr:hypothetical protein [Rhodococcus sp. SORGH_AS_0303]MDQ1202714.1 hypothetical protein [Rhodococcus sp. SORGH_AS_0303]